MSLSFDEIRNEAEEKYLDFELRDGEKSYRLLSPLRLPDEKRAKLQAVFDEMSPEAEDSKDDEVDLNVGRQVELMREFIQCVADTATSAKAILSFVGGDLPRMIVLFEKYNSVVSPGEASDSPS